MTAENRETTTLTAPPVALCGDPKDRDEFLWNMAWDCRERQINAFWLMSRGVKGYLLVATDRIKGIECPDLVSGAFAANNYWQVAEERGEYWFGQQKWGVIGLGINAAGPGHRSHEQLHIHVSGVRQDVKNGLDTAYRSGKIPKDLKSWGTSLITVTGADQSGNPQARSYRVVHIDSLKTLNLFKTLNDYVVAPHGEAMGNQTMIAIEAKDGPADGYYILNSWDGLPHPSTTPPGIAVCDSLLICK
ncbi:CDP-diacylglycerol diphosphatase [Streptomyces tubercidicus]|uniref:CDP-diacylglycerol diphosphatase n=1 Tax=Streptomyces tubercidicus TaxID=47759 RepID=UPI002E1299D4|nr:CDP-diacylglycerol diphosphatase [Streptomyces tubercidicus]WSX19418.1 CDP-diacylglycerol diphosphatase [Streptomyces tubercidicus]